MSRIVECVPNFSEGQRKEVIEAIANAIAGTDGCSLLDVDPGLSTNRTVYTFVGSPEAVVEGALSGARAAAQLIDMRRHHGEHPRLGAMDVCPFIPVRGVTMEDCVECAREFGERLAAELGVPVYLYGEAAQADYRRTVPQIRAGEYEGLAQKLTKAEWKPDFGLAEFAPHWGATMSGARKFLIAYNVNLLSTKEQAHRIALDVREQGRGDNQPGKLKCVQAIGWYLEEANLAQVSINITDHETTPIYRPYEEVCKAAKEMNLAVAGSQIVGLVPLKAMMQVAEHYIKQENLFILEEDQKIRLVIDRLGLHSVGAFNPKERIIEYMVDKEKDGPLISMTVKDFVLTVGARSPTPGGGSVAAITATLGAALGAMVGFLTFGNKKYSHLDSKMRPVLAPLYKTMKDLMTFVDADAAAFNDYMIVMSWISYDKNLQTYLTALKLPKSNPAEQKAREERLELGLKTAVSVPLKLTVTANSLWPAMKELATMANIACKSDLQVGAKSLETGVWGAYQNVMINLKQIKDDAFLKKIQTEADTQLKVAQENCAEVLAIINARKDDV